MNDSRLLEPVGASSRHRATRRAMHNHLDWLEAEAIHILREVAGQCRSPRCCSPAARIRWSCCAWPRRRSGPGAFPFPLLHIDTGHNFPK